MTSKSKTKSRTKSGSKNKKSKISNKTIVAIIIAFVAITGTVIVFSGYAAGPTAYQYSYNSTCEKKPTNVNITTGKVVTTTGPGIVTVPVDPKSDCVKYSAEEQSYRLYRATNGKAPDYKAYSELVQKMAGDRIPVPELVPQSFLDQYKAKTDAEFVTKVFQNVLYRTPGDNGASWAADMKKNGWSRKDAVFIISSSPEAQNNNIGKFSEFIKTNPTPVAITPNAQKTQDYRLKLINGKIEEIKILNYAILVNRNDINAATSYAAAKPKQQEVSKLMVRQGEINKEIVNLAQDAKNLTLRSPDISDAQIVAALDKANGYLASSWAATLEAGKKAEDLNLTEFYSKVQAQQVQAARAANARNVGTPGRRGSSGGSTGGAKGQSTTALTDAQVRFLIALTGLNTGSPTKYDPKPVPRVRANATVDSRSNLDKTAQFIGDQITKITDNRFLCVFVANCTRGKFLK
jgi:hypothetical protein